MTSIEAFSNALLALHALARRSPPHRLLGEALSQFRTLVPFDAAWWGECSAPRGAEPPASWQHGSLGLPASFAQEWNAVSAADVFARDSIAALGRVCRVSGNDDEAEEVRRFSRRHDLFHAMAITSELPDSGLMFFVVLYRGERREPFDDAQALLFGQYCRHLQQQWTARLQDAMRRMLAGGARSTALCEPDGRLLYIGLDVASLLARQFPGWQGTQLPDALAPRLARAPCTLRLGRRALAVRPCGGLLALALGQAQRQEPIAPREREAALLYAAGESYKAIARQLGLSPATVRTYLRDVYARLGVRTKLELRELLGLEAG